MRWSPIIVLAVAIGVLLNAVPSGVYVLRPGGAYEVQPRLVVPEQVRQEMGRLAFTAVDASRASIAESVLARFSRSSQIVPADAIRPNGISSEEMRRLNAQLIEESKSIAAVVALRSAGYDVPAGGQGATVQAVLESSPAAGILRPGDAIVAVDAQPTPTAVDVVAAVRAHRVGETVTLTVAREGQDQTLMVGTREAPDEPGRPAIGVVIATRFLEVALPFPVEIDTDNIGGASAGLMFSLGILDAVTPGMLTGGHFVAGTGTISVDGSVGPIGGVGLKVLAAEQANAEVFLVPTVNFDEAQQRAGSINVVAVDDIDDAIRYLCGLPPVGSAAQPADLCQSVAAGVA
jgi:PDZ domain-containing protein